MKAYGEVELWIRIFFNHDIELQRVATYILGVTFPPQKRARCFIVDERPMGEQMFIVDEKATGILPVAARNRIALFRLTATHVTH
jgi:hypothetical protein